ncbi:MAG: hypothetical protein HZB92_02370 [Euryarchaeota archaeon]|nr:hypothetical protein [Euryarchaeota archaeon]
MPNCPKCGGQVSYVEQYKQWYCYTCKEYHALPGAAPPAQPAQPQQYGQQPAYQAQPTQQYQAQQPAYQAQPAQQTYQQPAYQQYPAQTYQAKPSYKCTKITIDGHHVTDKADSPPDVHRIFDAEPNVTAVIVTKHAK